MKWAHAPFLLFTLVLSVGSLSGPFLVVSWTYDRSLLQYAAGGLYLDKIFSDHSAARAELSGNFTKRSTTAVAYVCFDRQDVINVTLSSLLESENLSGYDLIISQDGGSNLTIQHNMLAAVHHLYLRHPANLYPGLHHYFVKRFAFEIMNYEQLLIVEEDNKVHPQTLQVLDAMLRLSRDDPRIGLVSISDVDNSMVLDMDAVGNALIRVDCGIGNLWVYGIHATRYNAVRHHLYEYYQVIKGHDYRRKSEPPLSDAIRALHAAMGFPPNLPLSQDAFFISSLTKEGYAQRLTTLVRLFEPMGWFGLHSSDDISTFHSRFGKGMYKGRVNCGQLYEVGKDPAAVTNVEMALWEGLDRVYEKYLGRSVDATALDDSIDRLFKGVLNAVTMVHNILKSAEYQAFVAAQKAAQNQ